MKSLDLAALTRLLNALAGVAGGVAAPTVGNWVGAQLQPPFDNLARYATTVSGIAWAGASVMDILAWLQSNSEGQADSASPTPHLPVVSEREAQLALWKQLIQQP